MDIGFMAHPSFSGKETFSAFSTKTTGSTLIMSPACSNSWAAKPRSIGLSRCGKIVDADGVYVCNDDCESLGKWPSIISDNDFLVDVGCFFLPRITAVRTAPIWYRKAREPGALSADRMLTSVLRGNNPNYETSGIYTLNYRAGNTALSVRKEFFLRGNERMYRKLNGQRPWRAQEADNAIEAAPLYRMAANQ